MCYTADPPASFLTEHQVFYPGPGPIAATWSLETSLDWGSAPRICWTCLLWVLYKVTAPGCFPASLMNSKPFKVKSLEKLVYSRACLALTLHLQKYSGAIRQLLPTHRIRCNGDSLKLLPSHHQTHKPDGI